MNGSDGEAETVVVGSRDIRLYFLGLTASLFGTSAMTLVAGVWVKTLTGSNRAAALVSLCIFVPSLLAPLAGLVTDRVGRRRLLLLVNLAAAGGLLPLLVVHRAGQTWLIFVVMLGYGAVLVLVDPAETALFTELVPADARGRVNGLRLTIQEGAKLLAPLLGAALFAAAGGPVVAAVDAGTFLFAAAAVAVLRSRDVPRVRDTGGGPGWRAEVFAGLAHLRRTPALGRLVVVGALAMAASGFTVAAQYALVDALHRPPAFLGVLTSLLGAGSVVAGLLSGFVLRRTSERRLAQLGLVNGALGCLLTASGWLPAVLVGRVVLGLFLPWVVIAVITAGQRLTPDRLQGRVAAAITFLLFGAQPFTQAAGAALLGPLDYRTLYAVVAAAAALLLAFTGTHRARRQRGQVRGATLS